MVRELRSPIHAIAGDRCHRIPFASYCGGIHSPPCAGYLIKPIDYTVLLAAIIQGLQQKQVLRSVLQVGEEAAFRVKRLEKNKAVLNTWGTTISNPDIEEKLLTDPTMKESDVQWEKTSSIFTQGSPSSIHSPISPNDYVHLRESAFETIQILQKS